MVAGVEKHVFGEEPETSKKEIYTHIVTGNQKGNIDGSWWSTFRSK